MHPCRAWFYKYWLQPNQLVKQGDPVIKIAGQEFRYAAGKWVEANNRVKLARSSHIDEGVIAQRRVQETCRLADSEAALTCKAALEYGWLSGGCHSHWVKANR